MSTAAHVRIAVLVGSLGLLAGCGGSGSDSAGSNPASAGNPGTGGPMTTTLDTKSMCTRITSSVSTCAGGFQAQCEQAFQIAQTRGCALDALQTWILSNNQPYTCQALPGIGPYPTISSAAPEAAIVGDACAGAVTKAGCYGISCASYTDCPSGSTCNGKTKHCVKNNESQCGGLPCNSYTDCPSGHTCNSALGVCIRN